MSSRRNLIFLSFLTGCRKEIKPTDSELQSNYSLLFSEYELEKWTPLIIGRLLDFGCDYDFINSISIDGSAMAFYCYTMKNSTRPASTLLSIINADGFSLQVEVDGDPGRLFSISPNAMSLVAVIIRNDNSRSLIHYSMQNKRMNIIVCDRVSRALPLSIEAFNDVLCCVNYNDGTSLINPISGREYAFLNKYHSKLSPRGDQLATLLDSGKIRITKLKDCQVSNEYTLDYYSRSVMCWLPDGNHLLVVKYGNFVFWREYFEALNVVTGEITPLFDLRFDELTRNIHWISKKLLLFYFSQLRTSPR